MLNLLKGDVLYLNALNEANVQCQDAAFIDPRVESEGVDVYTLSANTFCPGLQSKRLLSYVPASSSYESKYLLLNPGNRVTAISNRLVIHDRSFNELCVDGHFGGWSRHHKDVVLEAKVYCIRKTDSMLVSTLMREPNKEYEIDISEVTFTREQLERTSMRQRNANDVDYIYFKPNESVKPGDSLENLEIYALVQTPFTVMNWTIIDLAELVKPLGHTLTALHSLYAQVNNATAMYRSFTSLIFSSFEMRAPTEGSTPILHFSVFQCIVQSQFNESSIKCRLILSMPGEDHGLAGVSTHITEGDRSTYEPTATAYINLTLSTPSALTTAYLHKIKNYKYTVSLSKENDIVGFESEWNRRWFRPMDFR